jgi:hypothetical protein
MNPISNSSNTPAGYTGPELGSPIGGGGHSHAHSTTTTGGAALAAGTAGDYAPNPLASHGQHAGAHSGVHSSSHDASALKGALGGSGGEGRDTSYETTHPQSGTQFQGEAQPHVGGRGGAGELGSHGHSLENSSRRDDGLLNKVEHGGTSISA